jgi:hypothetical protein
MFDPFRAFRIVDEQIKRDFKRLWAKDYIRISMSVGIIILTLYMMLLSFTVAGLGLIDYADNGNPFALVGMVIMLSSFIMWIYIIVWCVKQLINKKDKR